MRFEELISKYLDSELTSVEDVELRQYISEDPAKKVEFEEYIELSYILKKDSTFNLLSEEDESDIEDNLLMFIIDEQSKVKVASEFNSYSLSAVFSVILVFFVSIYSVFDTNTGYDNGIAKQYRISIPNFKQKVSAIKEFDKVESLKNNFIAKQINNSNQYGIAKLGLKDSENIENVLIEEKSLDVSEIVSLNEELNLVIDKNESNISDEKLNKIFKNENQEKIINSTSSNYIENDLNLLKLNYNENDMKFNDLSFESIIFIDINRTGFNPSDNKFLNSYSQSVAFKLTDKTRVGIEIGRSQYEFTTLRSVTIPYRDLDGFNGNLDGSIRMPNGLLTKVNITSNYNSFYANVFYDSKLFVSYNFKINGRIGAGVSNGGVLASGRLYADITIYGPLHITTGLDTRVFQNDNVYYNIGGQINSSVSFVNGLYFEF